MLNGNRHLENFEDVVDALGGKRKLAILLEQDTAAVCNWKRRRKRFPTKYYKVMVRALGARHYSAAEELWGFYERKKS
jgi:hypothetical protein